MDHPRRLEYVRLSDVRPALSNPRIHDLPSIKASIRELGYFDAGIIDDRTGRAVGGHGRVEALVEMRQQGERVPAGIVVDEDGEWLLPMQRGWASRDDTQAIAALIGLNKLTENARWNDYGLAELLEQIATDAPELLDAVGVDEEFMEELLRVVNPERLGEQDPDAPMPPAEPKPKDTDEVFDDGSQTSTLEEYQADKDKDPDNTTCPSCGHRFPRRV